MNWKSLQKDKDILVSHVHPPLWVSTAQSRKRKEMDSVASSSLNEMLLGLRQRLSPVSGGVSVLGAEADGHKRYRSWVCCPRSCTAVFLACAPRAASPLPVPWMGHWQPPQIMPE